MARLLRDAADARLVGHSDITTSLSRWHASFVLDSPTALWANLSSVALRDRAIRPAIMLAINPGAKSFLRSTFPRDDGLFVTFLTELHSWRFKEENAWRALYALDEKLVSKKPSNKTIADWRADLDTWREERRHIAGGNDVDNDNPHLEAKAI